jgi:hypothetical protein
MSEEEKKQTKLIKFGPLDVVISGWAFAYATTALGFLEGDSKSKISPTMLCTLDNFIKAILFSDRIFVTREPSDSYPEKSFPDRVLVFGASSEAASLFKKEHIFEFLELKTGRIAQQMETCRAVLKPVEVPKSPFCVISYHMKDGDFFQEMLLQDCVLIEEAISQCGEQRFKPIFPGDALYLGLRETRIPTLAPIETMTDIATRNIKNIIKTKMNWLNETVVLGSLPVPLYPPLFVNRILHDCSSCSKIVPTIIETRNSSAAKRFRQ